MSSSDSQPSNANNAETVKPTEIKGKRINGATWKQPKKRARSIISKPSNMVNAYEHRMAKKREFERMKEIEKQIKEEEKKERMEEVRRLKQRRQAKLEKEMMERHAALKQSKLGKKKKRNIIKNKDVKKIEARKFAQSV